jgi:hypothetical protein
MAQDRNLKSDPHDHENRLPKDVLNNEQDPQSFADPLEVEKQKGERMKQEQAGRSNQEQKGTGGNRNT